MRGASGWSAIAVLGASGCWGLASSREGERDSTPVATQDPSAALESPPPSVDIPPPADSEGTGQQGCREDGVHVGFVEVSSQAQLDELEGCERIAGSLILWLFEGIDEAPLLSLRTIEGALSVYGAALPTDQALDGFRSLERVGHGVRLAGLTVTDLEPLGRLTLIGPEPNVVVFPAPALNVTLEVSGCDGLTSLAGLDSLEQVDRILLKDNSDLLSLAGLSEQLQLQALASIGCPLLDLGGLESLSVVNLSLRGTALANLAGLGNASHLRTLELRDNAALVSLEGGVFPSHLDELSLQNSDALRNLQGLEGLRDVSLLTIGSDTGQSALVSLEGLAGLEQAGSLGLSGLTALPHLSGLGRLRRAESLYLGDGTALIDLVGVASLQEVERMLVANAPGLVSLEGLGNAAIGSLSFDALPITSLAGLEQVRVGDLQISNAPRLATLQGLPQFSAGGSLSISESPALADAQALAPLTALGSLSLTNTGLRDLDALAQLRQLERLRIADNPQLSQLDGMSGLVSLLDLQVFNNPALKTLPRFDNLSATSCDDCAGMSLSIEQNAVLESGPRVPLLERAHLIQVSRNQALTDLSGFSALRTVGALTVLDNPSLLRLDLDQLASAGTLLVRGNTALDDTPLAPLRLLPLGQVKIVSNRPGPSLLSPCPFTNDRTCDELYGDCAPGSDAQDCAGGYL